MKTIKIKAYTAEELKKKSPKGFERAFDLYRESEMEIGLNWKNEIMDSLKGIYKASGIHLRDWSIDWDYPGRSWVKIEFSSYGCDASEDIKNISGVRAQAWIENNLLSQFRVKGTISERWIKSEHVRQIGNDYGFRLGKQGELKDCPFTGYCFDDDLIHELLKEIKAGSTLGEAYKSLAILTGREMESEWEYQLSEECFLDTASANDWYFKFEGVRV